MNLIDEKRKLRTMFQAFILVAMVLFALHLEIELPKTLSIKTIGVMVAVVVSFVSLIFIMIRVNFNNVKRWEMVIYYSLNIVFVCLIVYGVTELCYMTSDYLIDNIPYVQGTDEYYIAYDKADSIGWTAGFMFVLLGIPSALMTIIFAIVGITLTCTQGNSPSQQHQSISTNVNQVMYTPNTQNGIRINYCSGCGNKVDSNAKFCIRCGKQIR